jgi:hypothetical protein
VVNFPNDMTSSKHELRGVLPVFQTPWHDDETLDLETLEREIAWLYDCGANGIVMAMVSETLRLDSEEREQLAAAACRFGKERGVVVISVGAESSKVAERYAKHAESVGADAVMAIPPVSIGIGESELLAYYTRIIQAIQIPVIVQDASGYVGKPMPIAMQARLLDEFGPERVQYKPEASAHRPEAQRTARCHARPRPRLRRHRRHRARGFVQTRRGGHDAGRGSDSRPRAALEGAGGWRCG